MRQNNKNAAGASPCTAVRSSLLLLLTAALAACQTLPSGENATAAADPAPVVPAPIVVALEDIVLPSYQHLQPIVVEPDLLARLRNELEWTRNDDPAVRRELLWFGAHQAYLDRVFERADRYLYYILGELEQRGMPAELALLPIVESAFDPFAYSRGRASGLWQIIPGTGKRLGLSQNWWFDGRRDVLESTRAALDYLAQMHEQFGGDWLLAVAGYNSGEGNVERAMKRAAAAGKPTDFWGIKSYLPVETRTYVPRLLAVRNLVADPANTGVVLPVLPNEPHFAVVDTGSQIDMALAAQLAGIGTDQLYSLNAGVNRWATDPEGPHRLLVPVEQADDLAAALDSLGPRERVQWTRHRVKDGETVGGLAEKYQTTPAVLREVNGLKNNLIRAGDYLMIPHALQALPSYTQSADARAVRQLSVERGGVRKQHVVQPGESLWSIAQSYGIEVRSLAAWNSMAPGDVLSVGRNLVVWTTDAGAPQSGVQPVAARAADLAPAAGNAQIREVTYVVRRGDSLSSIAHRFRVTVPKLIEWNAVTADKYLQPGQRLVMFVNVTEQSG